MKVTRTSLPEVLIIEPEVYPDDRGHFFEAWSVLRYKEIGILDQFVQDNISQSVQGTLRGLHFQEPKAQGKLIMPLTGQIFDAVVDIRRNSPRFGKWMGVTLDGISPQQLWIPPGFAHGFCVISERADFFYKCTNVYRREYEHSIRWNDPIIGIDWPITKPLLSNKDSVAPLLLEAPVLP